jgi:hypothetical protein
MDEQTDRKIRQVRWLDRSYAFDVEQARLLVQIVAEVDEALALEMQTAFDPFRGSGPLRFDPTPEQGRTMRAALERFSVPLNPPHADLLTALCAKRSP